MTCHYISGDIDWIRDVSPGKTIALDLETTGLNPDIDEILQLAIVDGNGRALFNQLFCPVYADSWPDAQRVNGISPSKVRNKPPFSDMAITVQDIIDEADLILVYNSRFDLSFLSNAGVQPHPGATVFDVMLEYAPLGDWWRSDKGEYGWATLESCAANYGHALYNAHDALCDATVTLKCFESMVQDDSANGYLELCDVCRGKNVEAWREHLHPEEVQRERERKAAAKADIDNEPAFDKPDKSIYSCFILGGDLGWNVLPQGASYEEVERIRNASFKRAEEICAEHGGRLFKTQAKGAEWAILANPYSCTYSHVEELHAKGYKVAKLPDFLRFLGVHEGWDIERWEELRASSEAAMLVAYGDDSEKRAAAEKRYRADQEQSLQAWEKAALESNRLEREVGAQFDEIDDSVYSCFILENTQPYVWSDKVACCAKGTLPLIESKCSEKGGRLYRSQAKGASWAIIAWPQNCTYENTSRLRAKGYKVGRFPEFMAFLKLKSNLRSASWEKKRAEAAEENRRRMAYLESDILSRAKASSARTAKQAAKSNGIDSRPPSVSSNPRVTQQATANSRLTNSETGGDRYIPATPTTKRRRRYLPIILLILAVIFLLTRCFGSPKAKSSSMPASTRSSVTSAEEGTSLTEETAFSPDDTVNSFLHEWNERYTDMLVDSTVMSKDNKRTYAYIGDVELTLSSKKPGYLEMYTYTRLASFEDADSSKGVFTRAAKNLYPGYTDDEIETFWTNITGIAVPTISDGNFWFGRWSGGSMDMYIERVVAEDAVFMKLSGAFPPNNESNSGTQSVSASTAADANFAGIFPYSIQIDSFFKSLNDRYPEEAFSAEDIIPVFNSAITTFDGLEMEVKCLGDGSLSIECEAEDDRFEVAYSNHQFFSVVMGTLNPELSDSDIEQRWQEVLENGEWVSWDDGIAVLAGPLLDENVEGSFSSICITE